MISNFFDKKKQKILELYKEKKYQDVIKFGEKLIKKKSNDAQLIYLLGLSSINLQKFFNAEKYFEKLLSLKKTHEIYYIYGNILKNLVHIKELNVLCHCVSQPMKPIRSIEVHHITNKV